MDNNLLKVKGFDFTVCFLTFIVTLISYFMTISMLDNVFVPNPTNNNSLMIDESSLMEFFRGSFVFLSPCALEGLNLLSNKATKKVYLDSTELIISILSIIFSIILFLIVFKGNATENSLWIQYTLIIYPVKIGMNLFSELIDLIRLRREK